MTASAWPRSPELMARGDTALVVIDVQEKLMPAINDAARLVWNIGRLLDGAKILGLPAVATEQYPKGLGATLPAVSAKLTRPAPDKLAFSAAACTELFDALRAEGRRKLLLVGVETHVCVQQSALDLIAAGFRVYLAVDAVGSRFAADKEIALRRLEASGVVLTTTEAALFEWCQAAGTAEFKEISRLVRDAGPA